METSFISLHMNAKRRESCDNRVKMGLDAKLKWRWALSVNPWRDVGGMSDEWLRVARENMKLSLSGDWAPTEPLPSSSGHGIVFLSCDIFGACNPCGILSQSKYLRASMGCIAISHVLSIDAGAQSQHPVFALSSQPVSLVQNHCRLSLSISELIGQTNQKQSHERLTRDRRAVHYITSIARATDPTPLSSKLFSQWNIHDSVSLWCLSVIVFRSSNIDASEYV